MGAMGVGVQGYMGIGACDGWGTAEGQGQRGIGE